MDKKGPLSIWAPLVDEGQSLSLVGYLGSHKPALALWVFMARHYAKMKEAYLLGRTETEVKDGEFLRVWIGAARLFMRREHPNERIVAERIRAKRFDVLLVHGLLVHGGTDEVGLRMFAGYSPVVSVAPINIINLSICSEVLTLGIAGFRAHQQRDSHGARQPCSGRNVRHCAAAPPGQGCPAVC